MTEQHEIKNYADFIKAGKAIFTILNEETGVRFTFKVSKIEDKENGFFVSLMNGPDNVSNYTYMGMYINDKFFRTKNSKVTENAISFKAFAWLIKMINSKIELPENVKFYHEGRCGRCGRRLTVPESIESGFGPECVKFMGV